MYNHDQNDGLVRAMRTRLTNAARRLKIITPLTLGIALGATAISATSDDQAPADSNDGTVPQSQTTPEHPDDNVTTSSRLPITTDDIAFLQRRLNAQGYEAGAVDGDFGVQSQQALLAKLREMPRTLARLGPAFIYSHLTQEGHLPELQAILNKSAAHRESYLKALYQQRRHFSSEHMQYHLKYFAGFYHGAVDGIAGQSTERAINQLEAHVDPPQYSDFDEQNLERATPEEGEIVKALETGNIEWLRWHMDIDESLRLGRPVDARYEFSAPYLDPERVAEEGRHHGGDDYATPKGTLLRTQAPARVVFAGDSRGYGNTVMLEHGAGTYTLWAHLSEIAAKPGAYLQPGDVLGKVGSTGRSTGPHLHYEELLYNGREAYEINPSKYDDYDLTDGQTRAYAIADAKSAARKYGFFGDVAVSAAFTMRARGKPSSYLDQDPANRAGLHSDFDPRTAQAIVDKLDSRRDLLSLTHVDVLHKLGRTPEGGKLARIMPESGHIASRLQDTLKAGHYKDAQKLLAASDYYDGAIDGILGPKSRRALRDYREAYRNRGKLSHINNASPGPNEPSLSWLKP